MIGRSTCATRASRGVAGLAAALVAMGLGAATASGGNGGIGSDGGAGGDTGGDRPAASTTDGVFPVRAKHSYGDGLGAGRGHEGQDLMAKCGKPVVAAEPGRVQRNAYHAAAGNYVVIDGKGKIEDMAYMHLKEPLAPAGRPEGRRGREARPRRRHGRRDRLPPALRDLVEPRLV